MLKQISETWTIITAGVLLNFWVIAKIEKSVQRSVKSFSVLGIFENRCGNSFITVDLGRNLKTKIVDKQYIRVAKFGSHTHWKSLGYYQSPNSRNIKNGDRLVHFTGLYPNVNTLHWDRARSKIVQRRQNPSRNKISYGVILLIGNIRVGEFLSINAKKQKSVSALCRLLGPREPLASASRSRWED